MRSISKLIVAAFSRLSPALLLFLLSTSAWADSLTLVSGAGQTGLGGSASAQPIVVQARNAAGSPVAGRTIYWTSNNGFLLSAPSSVTDAGGLASVSFTYGNYGTSSIFASDPTGSTSARALATSTGSDSLVLVSGSGQSGKTGSASTLPLVVELRNAAGNPIAGRTVFWSDQTTYTRVNALSSVTNGQGRASMGFTYLIGPVVLEGALGVVRARNSAGAQYADATMRVIGVNRPRIISGEYQSGLVGTTGTIVGQVTDPNGNPVANLPVFWREDPALGRVILSNTSTVTDAAGKTSITFQYRGGSGTILMDIGAVPDTSPSTSAFFRGINASTLVLLSPNGMTGAPGSVSPTPIVVELRDGQGLPVAGRTITWTAPNGNSVPDAGSSVTDASGRASMGFTFGTVGGNIQATDPVSGLIRGQRLDPSPMNTMRVVSGASQSGPSNTPAAQPVVVELLDSNGNPIPGRAINWSLNGGNGGSVTLAANSSVTDASGRASMNFTFLVPGRIQIMAQDSVTGRSTFFPVTTFGIDSLVAVSGDNQTGLPGTHGTQPLIVELRNNLGQAIVGGTISWSSSAGNATMDAPSSVTDAAGRASMGFTYSATPSLNAISANYNYNGSIGEVTFLSTSVGSNALVMVSGNGQSGQQGASGAQPLVVELRDASGQTVAGRSITWSTLSGTATTASGSSLTDASGRAAMTFALGAGVSTLAATDPVTAQQIRFSVVGVAAAGSSRIVSGDGQAGNVGSAGTQPIVIELRDGNNAPWAGRSITWSVVSGGATLLSAGNSTDSSGQASATFNFGPSTGSSIIQAIDSASGMLLQAAVTTLAAAGAPMPDTMTVMSGAGQSGLGGSPGSQPIVIELRNIDGVAVAGRTINWSASNGIVLQAPTSTTDNSGRASMAFTYGTSGTATVVASESVTGASASALVTATGSDSLSLISGGGQAGRAGATAAQPIVVELRNAAGNPVAGRTINWADEVPYTHVAAATSVTDAAGRASMSFTYLQGPASLDGAIGVIRASNSVDAQFVEASVNVLGFDVLRMVSVGSQSGLIGTAGTPIVVQVVDGSGSTPVPGVTVTWSERLSSGLVSLSASSSVTDATGKASINFQYLKPGSGEITATVGPSAVDMHFVSVGSERMNLVTPTNLFGSPGQVSPVPVTIEMVDVNNQPLPGRTINWSTIQGDAVLAGTTSVTDAAGRASMGFTYGSSASTIAAIDLQANNTDPLRFNYAASRDTFVSPTGSGNSMVLISGNGQLGLAGTAGAQPIVVELRNGSGAPIVGSQVRWSAFGSALVTSSNSVTDASGRASMTFTYGGPGQALIEVLDLFTGTYIQVFVAATGIETLIGISGSDQSGLVGTHSGQPLVAELRDASGQPVSGRAITWIVNGGNAVFDAPTSLTDASGRASMGFTFGPTASINGLEARDTTTGLHIGYFATAVGANSINLISGNGQTGLQNTVGTQPLVIEVRDAAGQPVSGRSISWNLIDGDAVLSAPSSLTDINGRASMGFTHGSNTTSTVAAIDLVSGQQVRFTLTSTRPIGSGVIVSGNGQSGLPGTAGAQPIVIELRSPTGAPLAGQAVAWSVLSGPATLGVVSSTTDAAGRASATFSFGTTPGTSIIQVRDVSSGQLLQAAVTALGSNQALTMVSGDGQTLTANVTSAPLVVQLKNFSNAPVAGATINWSTSSGTLASASTVTDADGQSSNTVTASAEGAITVTASSPLASSPITFTLTGGLAELPNLTPQQQSIAKAVDILCPALAAQGSLTPQQADLLARCQELNAAAQLNPGAATNALQELLSDTGQAQSNAAGAAVGAQFQNINTRLNTLRTGAPMPVSLSGLSFTGSGGSVSLTSLMNALAGDEKSPQKPDSFSRWGFFASGNIGRGESDAARSSPAYDYDIEGLTFGLDYRQRDNLVLGGALGLTRQDTDLAGDQGNVKMSGWSLSTYGTYSFKDIWYLDSVLTWGRNQYEMNRRIAFTVPRPGGGSTSINQLATGKPDGDLLSLALTFGGDFHKDALGISPYGQVLYSRTGFDAYQESLLTGPGSGLGLAVESRNVTALTGVLGSRFTYTHSTDWGVVIPTASLEWTHEFKDDPEAISASFIFDPTHTIFSVAGTPTDSDYLRMSVGLSMVLAHGRSGFFQYQWMAARDGQSQYNLTLGLRLEF